MSKSKINVYFFTNGQPLKPPHKIVIDRKKLRDNKVVERVNRLHYYNGFIVYTLFGELLRSTKEIHNHSAFVVVPRDRCFLPGPYLKAFREYVDEKLPSLIDKKKLSKTKKSTTKPKESTSGKRTPTARLKKDARVCPGCRHVPVDARCKHFGVASARTTAGSCGCQAVDPQGICAPSRRDSPKHKAKRKKSGSGLWGCLRKKQIKKEPAVRLRKMDLKRLEQQKAKKEQRPKSRQGSACCGKKPTRTEYYRNMREKMIKQRNQRIVHEEKRKIKEARTIQKRIKSKRRNRLLMVRFCPCCVKKPLPVLRPPPPHNCVVQNLVRYEACRRRQAQRTAEQLSWESITVPPMKKKRIRGTQTTKEDLKQARKTTNGRWKWCGAKKKTQGVENAPEPKGGKSDEVDLDHQPGDIDKETSALLLSSRIPSLLSLTDDPSKLPSESYSLANEEPAPADDKLVPVAEKSKEPHSQTPSVTKVMFSSASLSEHDIPSSKE
ncbi:uncharacterized protein LOC129730966 [Wyeomyia smithii]|uniref:uncharacterized protein LOC129730966 n=1 Tax=Wyeomyia smithii TaxID=174621 RepID=UPI0024681935|nr:uncharacterized protein LOC129730966 [Wyeomyia smithii]